MDWQEIRAHRDAALRQLVRHLGTRNARRQADDIHEPAHPRGAGHQRRGFHPGDLRQALAVPIRHLLAGGKQVRQARHLRHAQSRAHLVQAVVIAQVSVRKPGVAGGAPLVAQRAHQRRGPIVIGDDHPAFAGGDLFVGIKGEHPAVAKDARWPAAVFRAQRLARVFDQLEAVRIRDLAQRIPIRGLPEDIHPQHCLQLRPIRRAFARQPAPGGCAARAQLLRGLQGQPGVHVAGQRVHIHKDRNRIFKEDHIGRSHEGERGGEHQVAGADPRRAHAQVQPGGAGVDPNGMLEPGQLAKGRLKGFDLAAHTQVGRIEHRLHGLALGIGQVRGGHGNDRLHTSNSNTKIELNNS
jgi:hypothetical protein